MEEDASSMVSNAKFMNVNAETSDSYNSNYAIRSSKRIKHHHHQDNNNSNNNNNVVSTTAKFKGVVPQQNGRWGAQIYANHQRIWLGTFKSEKEAAMAYDRAAIKIRSGDSHRNFPSTDHNNLEPVFQNHYSTEAVLNMIRDGSYQPKFEDFIRVQSQREEINGSASCYNQIMVHGDEEFSCKQLFQKELTPSDVGKLNRLVIPKKYAVKYLPYIPENTESENDPQNISNINGGGVDDMELVFYDKVMRTWKFRYCYWKSSQSFVFTRGWNRFVKEKKLKEKDIVTFYACENPNEEDHSFYLIDVMHHTSTIINTNCRVRVGEEEEEDNLGDKISRNRLIDHHHHHHHHHHLVLDKDKANTTAKKRLESTHNQLQLQEKGFRLFGVQIN